MKYLTLGAIGVVTLIRIILLYSSSMHLQPDEAQYWGWSKALDFGYYSKPPMIAWIIYITTSLCGDGESCIRLGSPLLHGATSFIIFLIAQRLFDARMGLWASIVYLTFPGVSFSSSMITTDVALLFFWALALYFFIMAVEKNRLHDWFFAGAAAGFGLLSKYSMVIFLPCAVIFLLWNKERRVHLFSYKFIIALLVAFFVFLPNILWNLENKFVSFSHTAEISQLDRKWFHVGNFFEFIGLQAAIMGPIFFFALIFLLANRNYSEKEKLLFSFSIPFLFIMMTLSFISRAFGNWAAPVYIAIAVWVTYFIISIRRSYLIYLSIAIGFLIIPPIYFYDGFLKTISIPLRYKNDIWNRGRGFRELGAYISDLKKSYPDTGLLTEERKQFAMLGYYVKPYPHDMVKWKIGDNIDDHYDLTTTMEDKVGKDFIFVTGIRDTARAIAPSFEFSKKLDEVTIVIEGDYKRTYEIYYMKNFRGYKK